MQFIKNNNSAKCTICYVIEVEKEKRVNYDTSFFSFRRFFLQVFSLFYTVDEPLKIELLLPKLQFLNLTKNFS